jgi:isopropylmalate/homocitrate/citramalate synthase
VSSTPQAYNAMPSTPVAHTSRALKGIMSKSRNCLLQKLKMYDIGIKQLPALYMLEKIKLFKKYLQQSRLFI